MRMRLGLALSVLVGACGPGEAPPLDPDAGAQLLVEPLDASRAADAAEGSDAAEPLDAGAPRVGVDASARDASSLPDAASADAAPTQRGVPTLVVDQITGATPDELVMIAGAVELANLTMATSCFRDFVLAAAWTETEGLTQAQIWERLASNPVTVDVDMFTGTWYQNHVSRTIGYENEPGTVHMNRYFVDTIPEAADNLIHEAEGHSQGFSHYGVKSTSVPYGLNDAFEACAP